MRISEVIIIGVALAMDAFALTVANCTTYEKSLTAKKEWSMPLTFAIFQFLMPIAGYYFGYLFYGFISSFSSFLTAGVFFILSIKIVFDVIEERRKKKAADFTGESDRRRDFTVKLLFIQAIATSIDALAVGITFAAGLSFSVFIAAGIIGAVTFVIVALALFIGKSLGKFLGEYAVWVGAIILFALAVKNLAEGLVS